MLRSAGQPGPALLVDRLPMWAFLTLGCLWLLVTAWLRPLALPDEGRYVGVAWEMVRSGDWLTPTLDGLPYFHKPPLFYWITALSIRLFGSHEWSVRIAPWLGACLSLVASGLFTARWWSDAAGRAVVLVLATMPLFYAGAQFANLDMLVAGFISATILALAHSCLSATSQARRDVMLAGYACAGLGVLAKGLIGIALPGLVLLAWLIAIGRPARLMSLVWWPGLLLFLLITVPWFAAMQSRFPDFLHYFFVVQQFDRYTEAGFNNVQPWWFYPFVLAILALPWTLLLAARSGAPQDTSHRELSLLAWIWLITVVLFFSAPQSKLVGYILPALPPMAILSARHWLSRTDQSGRLADRVRWIPAVAAAVCVIVVVVVADLPSKSKRTLAKAVAVQPDVPVVFVGRYDFDLQFYAAIKAPVTVLDRWDDPSTTRTDNWRRELHDAAAFDPGRGSAVLLLPEVLQKVNNCPGARARVVGEQWLAEHYPLLASAPMIATQGGVAVWDVHNWSANPEAAVCTGHT